MRYLCQWLGSLGSFGKMLFSVNQEGKGRLSFNIYDSLKQESILNLNQKWTQRTDSCLCGGETGPIKYVYPRDR